MKPIKTFICVTLVVAATLPALAAPPAELFEFQQRISLELASDNDRFGYSAAIDGDRLVLGAPGVSAAGFESSGTAYIYLRTATGWEIERELEPSSPLNFGSFGDSVAISGNLVAIRSPKETAQASPFTGAVYVYERGGDGIWRELQRLISDQPDNQNAWGSALAFGDGGERRGPAWGFEQYLGASPAPAGSSASSSKTVKNSSVLTRSTISVSTSATPRSPSSSAGAAGWRWQTPPRPLLRSA